MKTTAIICPFAQFGSPGAAQGAELLADALREMLDDVKEEKRPTRGRAFRNKVHIEELAFDTAEALSNWRQLSAKALNKLKSGDFLIWIGGNHLTLLPVYEHSADVFPGPAVVQFDAHLDLYNLDDCKTELNHGNFLRHAKNLPCIVNVGHRDLFLPAKSTDQYYQAVYSATDIAVDSKSIESALREFTAKSDTVFFDIDCDVFDPAYFPATMHPMPFGLSPQMLLRLIDAAWNERVCGVAISEFDPGRDRDERSLQLLVWLIEWILLKRYE
jgi:agmatinase